AVVKAGAKLVYVNSRWGELVDFAAAWVRPQAGGEATALNLLTQRLLTDEDVVARLQGVGGVSKPQQIPTLSEIEGLTEAFDALRGAATGANARVAVVFAPTPV